jgi:hypothetical protein
MPLPKVFTTVIPFSKYLAMALFILLPVGAFFLGMRYQSMSQYHPKLSITNNSNTVLPDSPLPTASEIAWNSSPNALIISATLSGGRTTRVFLENYIPDARIWGDGRIVWVDYIDTNKRRILQGQLTQAQMHALLNRFINDGFFNLQDSYNVERAKTDVRGKCLSLELKQQSKKVCEYDEGAPQVFHDLYNHIVNGVGEAGTEYIPQTAYLTVHPFAFSKGYTPPVDFQRSAVSLGLSLGDTTDGTWIEGKTLDQAWHIVNSKWKGMIIHDDEEYYGISLQVPGVSLIDPPVR